MAEADELTVNTIAARASLIAKRKSFCSNARDGRTAYRSQRDRWKSHRDIPPLAIFHYEWVHYVAHIPYQPRTAFGRWIKQYHLRHHYINEKFWFGVSNPSMDLLGGTYKEAREVERSGTTRKLFG